MDRYSSLAGVDIIASAPDTDGAELRKWGAVYAHTVQIGLEEGETFEEMEAPLPVQAMELARKGTPDEANFWQGYLSRWD